MMDSCTALEKLYEACMRHCDNRKKISLKAKGDASGKTFIFLNKQENKVCVFELELCIRGTQKCCDYLLVDCLTGTPYFIELKGQDVHKAVEQLQSAINLVAKSLARRGLKLNNIQAQSIHSNINIPEIVADPKIIRFKRKMAAIGGYYHYHSKRATVTN